MIEQIEQFLSVCTQIEFSKSGDDNEHYEHINLCPRLAVVLLVKRYSAPAALCAQIHVQRHRAVC